MLDTIIEDYKAHGSDWTKPGFQALAAYRFGKWTKTIKSKMIRAPLSIVAKTAYVFARNFYGIELPVSAEIGRRVVFEHQHGIVIHGNAEIGDDCILRQGVTLGIRNMNRLKDAPKLGKGVDVGCGAKILGNVHVGNSAVIGANSVVTKDVHSFTTVVGAPAKVVRTFR